MLLLSVFIISSALSISDVIYTDGVGKVKLGMKIEDFLELQMCNKSIRKEYKKVEGIEFEVYNVYENEELIYAVEPSCQDTCKLWRIWIYGQNLKTEKGIGVGSKLYDIKKQYNILDFSVDEGFLQLILDKSDIGFLIRIGQIENDWWGNPTLEELDDNLEVSLIILLEI